VSGLDLTDVELAEFREVFKLVDKDGSGEIDAGEVHPKP
jgi:Ca2+-binding EF-hand superfamily protein